MWCPVYGDIACHLLCSIARRYRGDDGFVLDFDGTYWLAALVEGLLYADGIITSVGFFTDSEDVAAQVYDARGDFLDCK